MGKEKLLTKAQYKMLMAMKESGYARSHSVWDSRVLNQLVKKGMAEKSYKIDKYNILEAGRNYEQ